MQLLETHASWSTTYVNQIFKQIFNDLTRKHNLPRMQNKSLHLMLSCRTYISKTYGTPSCEHLVLTKCSQHKTIPNRRDMTLIIVMT